MRIPFGEWTPDLPTIGHGQLRKAMNVIARNRISYDPFRDLAPSFTALPAMCRGVAAVRQQDGEIRMFSGTSAALYTTLSGPDWTVASKAGGYAGLNNPWKFDTLDYRVFATNYVDPIQAWLIGTSSLFDDLSATAPKAKYLTTWFPGVVVVGYTNDTTDGERPSRVWWPAFDNATNWPTPGTAAAEAVQSDFRDLEAGGSITGVVGPVGGASGAVFCQEAIYRVDYEGPPTIFRILKIETDIGTNAPQSIATTRDKAFFLGNDGFYVFDGTRSHAIGSQKVDKTFWRNVHQGYLDRVFGVADPINKVVMWLYPTYSDGPIPARILAYNWETGRWTEASVSSELMAQFYTPSYTIDTIDDFGHIDEILPSLDSRSWLGGSQSLVGFTPDHRLGFFNGDILEADIETGDFAQQDGRQTFVQRMTAFTDGGTVTARSGYRDVQDETDSNVTYSPFVTKENDGTYLLRTRGQYQRFGIKIAASERWRHATGVDVTLRDGGVR